MPLFSRFLALLLALLPALPAVAQSDAAPNWLAVVEETPQGGVRLGNPDAPVRLVEYGARTCPSCAAFDAEAMMPLKQRYVATGQVSYEFRDYFVHGMIDLPPALLNRCVPRGLFFDMLDAIFADQRQFLDRYQAASRQDAAAVKALVEGVPATSVAKVAALMGYDAWASRFGLDAAAVQRCLTDTGQIDALIAASERARAYGVRGTPSLFLNGRQIAGSSWAELEPQLTAALAE